MLDKLTFGDRFLLPFGKEASQSGIRRTRPLRFEPLNGAFGLGRFASLLFVGRHHNFDITHPNHELASGRSADEGVRAPGLVLPGEGVGGEAERGVGQQPRGFFFAHLAAHAGRFYYSSLAPVGETGGAT